MSMWFVVFTRSRWVEGFVWNWNKKGLRVNFKKIVIVEVRECHPVGQLMSTPTSQWGSLSPSS